MKNLNNKLPILKGYNKFIPVHEPDLDNLDYKSVLNTLKKKEISGSFTSTINLFEKKFAKFCGVKYAVSVSNCTNALQLACKVVGIKKNETNHNESGSLPLESYDLVNINKKVILPILKKMFKTEKLK